MTPSLLRLPNAQACRPAWISSRATKLARRHRQNARAVIASFAFCADEASFARELLSRRPQLWLFRSHQRRFCGDFVLVDMSDARATRRRAVAIDLKMGGRIRNTGGVQMSRLPDALEALIHRGVISDTSDVSQITGDARVLLARLGAR